MTRAIPASINDYVEIGSFSNSSGAFDLSIDIVINAGSFSGIKSYRIKRYFTASDASWYIIPYGGGFRVSD